MLDAFHDFSNKGEDHFLEKLNDLLRREVVEKDLNTALYVAAMATEANCEYRFSEEDFNKIIAVCHGGICAVQDRFRRNAISLPILFWYYLKTPKSESEDSSRRKNPVVYLKRNSFEIEVFTKQTLRVWKMLGIHWRPLYPNSKNVYDAFKAFSSDVIVTTLDRYAADYLLTIGSPIEDWSNYSALFNPSILIDEFDELTERWGARRVRGNSGGSIPQQDLIDLVRETETPKSRKLSQAGHLVVPEPKRPNDDDVIEFDLPESVNPFSLLFDAQLLGAFSTHWSELPLPFVGLFNGDYFEKQKIDPKRFKFISYSDERQLRDEVVRTIQDLLGSGKSVIVPVENAFLAESWDSRLKELGISVCTLDPRLEFKNLADTYPVIPKMSGPQVLVVQRETMFGSAISDLRPKESIILNHQWSLAKREKRLLEREGQKSDLDHSKLAIVVPQVTEALPYIEFLAIGAFNVDSENVYLPQVPIQRLSIDDLNMLRDYISDESDAPSILKAAAKKLFSVAQSETTALRYSMLSQGHRRHLPFFIQNCRDEYLKRICAIISDAKQSRAAIIQLLFGEKATIEAPAKMADSQKAYYEMATRRFREIQATLLNTEYENEFKNSGISEVNYLTMKILADLSLHLARWWRDFQEWADKKEKEYFAQAIEDQLAQQKSYELMIKQHYEAEYKKSIELFLNSDPGSFISGAEVRL